MDGGAVIEIRNILGLSETEFSNVVGVSPRSIRNWETAREGAQIPIAVAHSIRTFYQEPILAPILTKWADVAFNVLPSELVCLWVVERTRCILFPAGNRLALYDETSKSYNPELKSALSFPTMSVTFVDKGLTTIPIQKARILRLAGEEIRNHPNKRVKGTRSSNLLRGGEVESLLHCPVFVPGKSNRPEPVMLLGFQNKLENHQVVKSKNGEEIFTYADFGKVDKLIQEEVMEKEILHYMKLLDMVGELED